MGTITKDDKSPNSLDRYKELPGALAEQSGAATGHLVSAFSEKLHRIYD